MERKVLPQQLQFGDTIVLNQQPCQVKYVEQPDHAGACDVYVVDPAGNPHHEIITDPVIIRM